MSDTPTKEAVQVPGTPCITITKFPSAFAHAARPPSRPGCARPGLCPSVAVPTVAVPALAVPALAVPTVAVPARGRPTHTCAPGTSRGGLDPRGQRGAPAGISTFPSRGARRFPAEWGFAAGERPGKAERPGRGPARRRSPACGAAPRARGSRGRHGHRLCCGYSSGDIRSLPQMHTSSPKSPFSFLIVLQICPYLYITSPSIYICT